MSYLYVVLTPEQADGHMVTSVFTTLPAAEAFIAKNPQLGACVQGEPVHGNYQSPAKVFAAHNYLAHSDTFDFVGLYSDSDAANEAGGEPSRTTSHDPK